MTLVTHLVQNFINLFRCRLSSAPDVVKTWGGKKSYKEWDPSSGNGDSNANGNSGNGNGGNSNDGNGNGWNGNGRNGNGRNANGGDGGNGGNGNTRSGNKRKLLQTMATWMGPVGALLPYA
jgi:hypothetical protein